MIERTVILALTGMLVIGCQSSSERQRVSAGAGEAQAVTCNQCRVTWAKVPYTDRGRVVGYTTRKSMECPECRSVAENFFQRGKFEHTCSICGPNAMEVCKTH
jgi:hypothetical protein